MSSVKKLPRIQSRHHDDREDQDDPIHQLDMGGVAALEIEFGLESGAEALFRIDDDGNLRPPMAAHMAFLVWDCRRRAGQANLPTDWKDWLDGFVTARLLPPEDPGEPAGPTEADDPDGTPPPSP